MRFLAPGKLITLGAIFIAGCASENATPAPSGEKARLPWSYAPLGAPAEPADNRGSQAKIDLGRLLFHDPVLSGDRATACVTCHSQYWGMGDGIVVGIGVGGTGPSGIGRRGTKTTRRNVPTLWNVAYRAAIFWDGRVSSLESQVEVPLTDDRELGGDPVKVMGDLQGNEQYRALFAAAFPDDPQVSRQNVTRAIASFVRTIVSTNSPYDRYAGGDEQALTALEVRGMFLFDELGCATCHAPPLFGADRFDSVVPVVDPAPGGSGADWGRFHITGDDRHRGAFRVPQLRNLRETGPFFHDGRTPTMLQAIRDMTESTATRPASDEELAAVAEFVGKGLMDKLHVPERPLYVPSGLPVPADGFTIRR